MYAIYKDNNFTECVGAVEFSDTVFQTAESLTDEQRVEFDVYEVADVYPPLTSDQHRHVEQFSFQLNGRQLSRTWAQATVPVEEIKQRIAEKCERIDAQIANIYNKWLRFSAEYNEREAAARAFKAANYVGDAGVWVTAFASAAGIPVRTATDTIIAQADSLKGALVALGALRMRKYEILKAATLSDAQAAFDSITAQAETIAAGLK